MFFGVTRRETDPARKFIGRTFDKFLGIKRGGLQVQLTVHNQRKTLFRDYGHGNSYPAYAQHFPHINKVLRQRIGQDLLKKINFHSDQPLRILSRLFNHHKLLNSAFQSITLERQNPTQGQ